MKKLPLHIKILIGLLLGVVWAFFSSAVGLNQFTINWIDPFGVIFIRMLKFIAVPLVLFSIIVGVSGLKDLSSLGRMGLKTLGFYLLTTVTAVAVGLLLVNVLQPGKSMEESQRVKNRIAYELWVEATPTVPKPKDGRSFLYDPQYRAQAEEVLGSTHMDSLARSQAASTPEVVDSKVQAAEQSKEAPPLQFLIDFVPDNIFTSLSSNQLMLQVIFFGIFFGLALVLTPAHTSAPVISVIAGINEVFLKMVDLVMRAAPFFVFALLAGVIAQMADTPAEVWEIFKGLGSYSLAVVLGLAFMVFVFYPLLIHFLVKGLSYKNFLRGISPAQLLAFSTSSSAATLPVTMECVEENLGVSNKVTSFVLPIGATVNMDGTSLYQGVAVVFLAQLHMIDLSLGQQLTIVLTATLASIGSAAVPSAGLVMLIIVLQSVGLNPAWIAIIFPVDRILDMCRTVVNVTGDATVSTLIAESENKIEVEQALDAQTI
jgi:Na+/H+-dicarboxylate symporter